MDEVEPQIPPISRLAEKRRETLEDFRVTPSNLEVELPLLYEALALGHGKSPCAT